MRPPWHKRKGVNPISIYGLKKYADKNNNFTGSRISNVISR